MNPIMIYENTSVGVVPKDSFAGQMESGTLLCIVIGMSKFKFNWKV